MENFSQLEIAHVLFMDIVGYSKKAIDQQSELLGQLNQVVRGTEQFRAAEAAGKLVRLPTGDGMALAFFTSVDAPVRCALEVAEALKIHPRIELRMGVDSGDRSQFDVGLQGEQFPPGSRVGSHQEGSAVSNAAGEEVERDDFRTVRNSSGNSVCLSRIKAPLRTESARRLHRRAGQRHSSRS